MSFNIHLLSLLIGLSHVLTLKNMRGVDWGGCQFTLLLYMGACSSKIALMMGAEISLDCLRSEDWRSGKRLPLTEYFLQNPNPGTQMFS